MITRNCKNILNELSKIEELIKVVEAVIDNEVSEVSKEEILRSVFNNYSIFKSSKAS